MHWHRLFLGAMGSAQFQDLDLAERQQCHERQIETFLAQLRTQSKTNECYRSESISETPKEPASDKIGSRAAAFGRARANSVGNAGCDDYFLRHS